MSTPSPPPQDVPPRRSSEELAHSNHMPSHGVPHRPSFRGLNHGDGMFASPREIVGNILSSNLSGSPLSRAGYAIGRNCSLILAHLTIPCSGFFNTAITFIQLPPRLDRRPYLIHKMILGRILCSCQTWLSPPQNRPSPPPCQRPHPMNSLLAPL